MPFASWFIARTFLDRWALLPRWVIALSVLFAGMIVASGARTAMLAMVISTIAVNFGEAIFFATGGMGLLMWAVIGFGLARARVDRFR